MIAFFCVSCYNADRLIKYHDEDINIRNWLNLATECIIVFVGFYIGYICYKKDITKLQICFFGHISPFLILSGLAAISSTTKRIINN